MPGFHGGTAFSQAFGDTALGADEITGLLAETLPHGLVGAGNVLLAAVCVERPCRKLHTLALGHRLVTRTDEDGVWPAGAIAINHGERCARRLAIIAGTDVGFPGVDGGDSAGAAR